ncbi:hypothetical protein BOX15_Mlig001862g10, partial [Macrostomum lignano]
AAAMERIGSKASDLRLLLNRVDSRKELIDQVNGFFDDAVQQLEARRAELLADIRRHSVAADQQQQLVGVVSEIERLADSARATPPSAADWTEERLRDVEERLDSCLRREAELLQVGRFDAELATRRTGRLLDGLRIDWHDEWAARRQADNPFAALSAAAAEADADDADSQEEDWQSSGAESDSLAKAKAPYQLTGTLLDFGAVLQPDGGGKRATAAAQPHKKRTRTRGKKQSQQQQKQPMAEASNPSNPVESLPLADEHQPPIGRLELAASVDSHRPAVAAKNSFDTGNRPASLAFLHGSFFVLEQLGGSGGGAVAIRVYDRRGRFKYPLPLRMGGEARPHRVRVCHQRGWLLILDRSAGKVLCVKSNGSVDASFGPTVTKRFSLHQPEDVVCTGEWLFIACPSVGIFIVSLPSLTRSEHSEADGATARPTSPSNAEEFRLTQTNASLGLNGPVRLAWNFAERWLVVIDSEPGCPGRYSAHRFRFELAGSSSRLVRWSNRPALLDTLPDCPPSALVFRSTLLLAMTDSAGVGRVLRTPAGRAFDKPDKAVPAGAETAGLRWSCQAEAASWLVTDSCYMNTQEFAVGDSRGVCVLSL